jgi:hypothetical protein
MTTSPADVALPCPTRYVAGPIRLPFGRLEEQQRGDETEMCLTPG